MRDEVLRKYEKEQPVRDIERQLGENKVKEEVQNPLRSYAFKERFLAIESLFTFATTTAKDECTRRGQAMRALASLAGRQEGRRARIPKQSAVKEEAKKELLSTDKSAFSSKGVQFHLECEPTRCIFCLGQQDLPMVKRKKSFHKPGLKKHFLRRHLKYLPKDNPVSCPHPSCNEVLQHTMHLQSHAQLIHKTRT